MRRLDPELVPPLKGMLEATGGGFDLSDIPATRAAVDGAVKAGNAEAPPVAGVLTEDLELTASDGADPVPARIYRPEQADDDLPVLLWMHPGGFVIGSLEMNDLMARELARDCACAVVSIDYRLAPENPYPAALDDCYNALLWISRNASARGFDADRIAVGGASAGGSLAASLALLARDRSEVKPMFQLLLYPDVDDRALAPASATVEENLFWSRENTRIGWHSYLNGQEGSDSVDLYAAAARADDLSGLPDAFIGVGTADMLIDGDLAYAERLSAAGAKVELRVYPGACHAFDSFAPEARISQQFAAERTAALRRAFGSGPI